MKKFGTPIGAGPGRASGEVGLAGVGTPLLVTGGGGVGALAFLCDFLFFFLVGDAGCVTLLPACAVPRLSFVGFWELPFPEPVDPDVPEDLVPLVEVVDVDEPEPDPDDGLGLGVVEVEVEVEVVCGCVVVVTVTAGVVAVTGGHDCETLMIG